MCGLEAIGVSSIFKLIRRAVERMCPTFDLSCEENSYGSLLRTTDEVS